MNYERGLSFVLCTIFAYFQCAYGENQCFVNCVSSFRTNVRESLNEFEDVDKLHALDLRDFLRRSEESRLRYFCTELYQPFLICMTKCPKTLGRDWGIWDYRALSHVCMDYLQEFADGLSCLHAASDDTDQECRAQKENFINYFQYVDGYLESRLDEERAGERIQRELENFCNTIPVLINCEKPLLESRCPVESVRAETDLVYMYLGTAQSRLYAAKLMSHYPENCRNTYDRHFGNSPKIFGNSGEKSGERPPKDPTSTSECFVQCVSDFHTSTEQQLPHFMEIDELHGISLRDFLRQEKVTKEQLQQFCQGIYKPFLGCMIRCPKSTGRDWGIWDYRSLTSICVDNLDAFSENLDCLKHLEINTYECERNRRDHRMIFQDVERNPSTSGVDNNKLSQLCSTLETMMQCEDPKNNQVCRPDIVRLEKDLHYMYLGQIQSRLHSANLDHRFPDNCRALYDNFLRSDSNNAGNGGNQSPAKCVINCVIDKSNATYSSIPRFASIEQSYGFDLRRFVRMSSEHELRTYCKSVYNPYITCLTKCPKNVGRDLHMWDYIGLTHICIDHLDEFAEKLVCLREMEKSTECTNDQHQRLFSDLKVQMDRLSDAESARRIQDSLEDYCPVLDDLIECEKPIISKRCSSKRIADLEHDLLIMFLATVENRIKESQLTVHYSPNCTALFSKLLLVTDGGSALSSNVFSSVFYFCIFIVGAFFSRLAI